MSARAPIRTASAARRLRVEVTALIRRRAAFEERQRFEAQNALPPEYPRGPGDRCDQHPQWRLNSGREVPRCIYRAGHRNRPHRAGEAWWQDEFGVSTAVVEAHERTDAVNRLLAVTIDPAMIDALAELVAAGIQPWQVRIMAQAGRPHRSLRDIDLDRLGQRLGYRLRDEDPVAGRTDA